MTATAPELSAAELDVMNQAAAAFLASQGHPDNARLIQPAGEPAASGPDAGRGWWRWPGASGPRHEDVDAAAFFPSATGITAAELDLMRTAGARFLERLLGGTA